MKSARTRVILLITVAVLIVGILGIAFARRGRTVQRAYTLLQHAEGLREGASVTYRGVFVGSVDRMAFDTNGIRADLSFHDSVPLRVADTAVLRTLGLIGDRALDIIPGPHTAPPLPDNGRLPARAPRPDIAREDLIKLLQVPPETVYREPAPDSTR